VRFVESGKEQIDGTITDYDHLCLRKYTDEAFAMTRRIPLVAEHRWYGLFMLGLALLTASLTNGILAATIPPSIQGLRILLIVAACLLPGILGLLITHIFIWPAKYKRIAAADLVDQLPATKDYTLPRVFLVLALVVALLLVAAEIATVLRVAAGMLAALMIASAASVSNLVIARRLQQLEHKQQVVYYGVALSPSFNSARRLVVLRT